MRTLVVYYSRSGNTRKLGRAIARALECDEAEIVDRKKRSGFLGFIASSIDALKRGAADIEDTGKDPVDYDLVIIGTPVWAWSVSAPVSTYLEHVKDTLPEVAFFLTTDMTGIERTFRKMGELCGKQPAATLGLRAKDVRKDRFADRLSNFLAALPR